MATPVIDKAYFRAKPMVYFRDFVIAMAIFVAAFAWGMQVDGPMIVVPYLLAMAFFYRAGIFAHEIVHQERDPRMRLFYWVWQLTCGAIMFMPSSRFYGPHQTHHADGIFRTKEDPQYPLVRSNPRLMMFFLLVLPFATPVFAFLQALVTSVCGLAAEEALDRYTVRTFNFSVSSPLEGKRRTEVIWLSRYSVVLFALYAVLLPETLWFYYAVMVGGWFLIVARIPLEHELKAYSERSDRLDQMLDSFTIENPLAVVIQPTGLRYHTAHHMYPGVPYHNLPAVHSHLKKTLPAYNNSVVSYWRAIQGPTYTRPAEAPLTSPGVQGNHEKRD
jgi:fatty acid desaturase